MVASRCTVIASSLAAFVDVITGISGLAIVDDMFTDRGHLVRSWCGLGMNQGLFLRLGGLCRLLDASLRRLEVELSACCMAVVSMRPRISSQAQQASNVDGSGILRRSMAATTTFWLA
jgi:hypothetical protein